MADACFISIPFSTERGLQRLRFTTRGLRSNVLVFDDLAEVDQETYQQVIDGFSIAQPTFMEASYVATPADRHIPLNFLPVQAQPVIRTPFSHHTGQVIR